MGRQAGSSGSSSAGGRTHCRPCWSQAPSPGSCVGRRSGRPCSLHRPWSASGTGPRRPPRSEQGRWRTSRASRPGRDARSRDRGSGRSPAQSRCGSGWCAMDFSASAPRPVAARPRDTRKQPSGANACQRRNGWSEQWMGLRRRSGSGRRHSGSTGELPRVADPGATPAGAPARQPPRPVGYSRPDR